MKCVTNIQKWLKNILGKWGTTWGVLGPIGVFIPQWKPDGWKGVALVVTVLAISVCWAVWMSRKKESVKVMIPGKDGEITIEVGDIFEGEGVKFIPVNEYFDCKVGETVAERSLHGQFIKKIMKNNEERWQKLVVVEGLEGIEPERRNVERRGGIEKRDQYTIGTCAHVPNAGAGEEYFLVALSRTDRESLKAKAGFTELCTCIIEVCKKGRQRSEGREVVIPLFGTGLSNTGIPAQQILDLLILLIRHEAQKEEIAKHIKIVISGETVDKLDLNETERRWKK